MRTLIFIISGLLLFGLCVLGARFMGAGGPGSLWLAVKIFVPLWFIIAAVNMWIGVTQAGYSFGEELPIFLLLFGLPSVVAALIAWKFSA